MNEAESALVRGQLRRAGYRLVRDPAEADVVLLNTCAVRERAEERVFGRTTQLLAHRRHRPDQVIGILGCMAEHLRASIRTRAPHVGLVVGPDGYRRIGEMVDAARDGRPVVDVTLDRREDYAGLDESEGITGPRANVTIQRGCDKFCTFCVVPFTRGRERSVPPREVLRRVRGMVEAGAREIVLLGQTVNSYRHEDATFADLLRAVARVDGVARVRFTSPYPVDFDDALIEVMATEPAVCPQVHLPLQSGSDTVLDRMGRGYDLATFVHLVERLRAAIPGICLSTDLMVGFCGETEDDHRATLAAMEAIRFDTAFCFAYSDRGITRASKRLSDDVPPEVKRRRLAEVIELQDGHTRASLSRRVGDEVEVLVEGTARRGDRLLGRCRHFWNVLLPLGSAQPGSIVRARVEGSTGRALLAHPMEGPSSHPANAAP
ncbi:MAG: tRNA (N6-isopentenyl adenosine(37)-C2)-methylthiotransferase MiaB [Deltaproteobacteria bacterium]|nr:MAG: tRNA (N6-isopentenyl adenosine(37)-C2)-methylthiotransferase MiaB [Deltaproteobacteria bacterium]